MTEEVRDINFRELNTPSVDFLMLADRAEALNGKLYMMGGAWDRYTVASFEAPISISFAIGILVPWNATDDEHALRVTIEHTDRVEPPLFGLDAGFKTGRPPLAIRGQQQRAVLALPAAPVKFPSAGTYEAVAQINGEEKKRVAFYLVDANAPLVRPTPPTPPA